MTKDGTLFFSSTGTDGNPDIYFSKWVNGKFELPVRLDANVNSELGEIYPAIAPDGSYLIFASTGRPDAKNDGYPRSDLYISFFKDGQWTLAKNMGRAVNTAAEESSPSISSDGSKICFMSERNFISMPVTPRLDYKTLQTKLGGIDNGLGNVYEISSSVINDLR
jgi:Tol biopolymer transport system component